MSIAVIMPTLNRGSIITEALYTVHAQTLQPECVVIADGLSKDNTIEVIRGWEQANAPTFKLIIIEDDSGVSRGRNLAVEATGEVNHLAFLDSDDLWPVDYLQRAAELFDRCPELVAASTDLVIENVSTGERQINSLRGINCNTTAQLYCDPKTAATNTLMRADIFKQCGGFDEALLCTEDYKLSLQASLLGQWGYIKGDGAIRRMYFPNENEVEQHLSKKYQDRRLTLAQMLADFIADNPEHKIPEAIWKRRLGKAWHAAGRQLRKIGRKEEAHQCFKEAVDVMPTHWRAQWRLITG